MSTRWHELSTALDDRRHHGWTPARTVADLAPHRRRWELRSADGDLLLLAEVHRDSFNLFVCHENKTIKFATIDDLRPAIGLMENYARQVFAGQI